MELSSSDDDSVDLNCSDDEMVAASIPPTLDVGTFVVVKVYTSKTSSKIFIGQLTKKIDEDRCYKLKFSKHSCKVKNGFIFPEQEDLASFSHDDVICVLSQPLPVAQTSRLSSI